nr:ribonuclease H-like domain-containing protein [Tanacetum cinerariifolium]
MRPFGCPVTILNTKDHLGKFDGKANEGFFVGYSLNSKAFRVFNIKTKIVKENLHIRFSENTPNIAGSRPNWLFDIDALTKSMNYKPVIARNQSNDNADNKLPFDPEMPELEDISTFTFSNKDEDDSVEADMNNLDTTIQIKEEVYVCQPPGFKDPDFLDKVYKVAKALYGLHQAPRACMVKNLDNVNKFLMYPRNMTRVGKDFSGRVTPLFSTMMVQAQEEIGEGSTNPTNPHHTPTIIQPLTSQPPKKHKSRRTKRKDSKLPQISVPTSVADKAVNEEINDSLERAVTTATSLDAEQDRGKIIKTQSKATPNEPGSQRTSLGGGPRCQEAIGDVVAQTRFERVSKIYNDPLLAGVNTPRSGEDSLKFTKLMELCTNLQNRVLDLKTTKITQALDIDSLKRRVKKLKRRKRSRTHGIKRLWKVGLSARVESSEDEDMFGVNDLDSDEVIVESKNVAKQAKEVVVDDITLAKALMSIKSAKPKANKVVIQEPEHGITTTTPTTITAASSRPKAKVKDKGKGKMVEPEPMKKFSKKDQLMLDEELAFKLQAEEEEEKGLLGKKLNKLKKSI